jgi:hypothetical protein
VPRHVARLITRLLAPLVVDYSASRRLVVVDYFAYAARPGASSRGSSRGSSPTTPGSSSTTSPPSRVRVPRHVAWLITRLLAPFVVDYSASRRLVVVDYFAYAARPGAASRGSSRGSSPTTPGSPSTTSPPPRVWVPQHVARLVTRLVVPLVVDYSASRRLVVDYSVPRDFVLRPRWLYFIHAVRRDYLSRGNTGSTSSTPRAATTSSSGRIALTIHLD